VKNLPKPPRADANNRNDANKCRVPNVRRRQSEIISLGVCGAATDGFNISAPEVKQVSALDASAAEMLRASDSRALRSPRCEIGLTFERKGLERNSLNFNSPPCKVN
jgi:hypothetical protein